MPEVLDKEAIDFLTRFGGGLVSALEELIVEWAYWTHPEIRTNPLFTRLEEHLPMNHQLLIGGISIGEALLGLGIEEDPLKLIEDMPSLHPAEWKTKEALKQFGTGLRKFGEGGVFYSAPMLVRKTVVRNVPTGTASAKGRESPPAPPEVARQGRVIKL